MVSIPIVGLVSHTRKVQSLYKRAVRTAESWYDRREVFRYFAVLVRARFEQNRCIKDRNVAKAMLANGEEELFLKSHWHYRRFPSSPLGVACEREVEPSDWVLDHWHPLEKAQYPQYFATREKRKREFLKMYDRMYPKRRVCP